MSPDRDNPVLRSRLGRNYRQLPTRERDARTAACAEIIYEQNIVSGDRTYSVWICDFWGIGEAGETKYALSYYVTESVISGPSRCEMVKTTLEIPDPIFRRARSVAAQRGIPLRAFVTEAVTEKLEAGLKREERPWVRLAGGLKHLHKETERVHRVIKNEFEKIEPDWA